jgi:hypothetical protein
MDLIGINIQPDWRSGLERYDPRHLNGDGLAGEARFHNRVAAKRL